MFVGALRRNPPLPDRLDNLVVNVSPSPLELANADAAQMPALPTSCHGTVLRIQIERTGPHGGRYAYSTRAPCTR